MVRPGQYKRVPRTITPEEKVFIKLVSKGVKRAKAFRMAYPEHPTVKQYLDLVKTNSDPEGRRKAQQSVSQLAKDKLQTKHINEAMVTYNKKMEVFTDKALETAIDLVENARSEKVRADLAIEGMRHRVGTPVQKIQQSTTQDIVITFGDRHPDDVDVIEGEVVE